MGTGIEIQTESRGTFSTKKGAEEDACTVLWPKLLAFANTIVFSQKVLMACPKCHYLMRPYFLGDHMMLYHDDMVMHAIRAAGNPSQIARLDEAVRGLKAKHATRAGSSESPT